MARKKKSNEIVQNFYVYYDFLTKQLLSVTNEKHPIYEHFITIDIEEYDKLVSGEYAFSDVKVDYIADDILGLVPIVNKPLSFNNNINQFIIIDNIKNNNEEFIVQWHGPTKHWIFFMSDLCKEKIMLNYVPKQLEFYIILESDYDLLIRTMTIETQQLLNDTIYIPFVNAYEDNILTISVATKSVFKSYRLDIINE